MIKTHKKFCTVLRYIKHLLTVAFAVTGCIFIFRFACLVDIRIGIRSSAVGWKIGEITTRIKKYNSLIQKKRKNHNKIVFSAKS